MKKEFEKGLKRFLKRKVKITMGVIVSFMIMGNIGYAEKISNISGIEQKFSYDENRTFEDKSNNGTVFAQGEGSKITITLKNGIELNIKNTEKYAVEAYPTAGIVVHDKGEVVIQGENKEESNTINVSGGYNGIYVGAAGSSDGSDNSYINGEGKLTIGNDKDIVKIEGYKTAVFIGNNSTANIYGENISIKSTATDYHHISSGVRGTNKSTITIGNEKTNDLNIQGNAAGITLLGNSDGTFKGRNITISGVQQDEGNQIINKNSIGISVENSTLNLGDNNTDKVDIIGNAGGIVIQDGGKGTIIGTDITISAISQEELKGNSFRIGVYASGESINEDGEIVDTVNIKGTNSVTIFGMDRGINIQDKAIGTITGKEITINKAFKEEGKEVQVDKNNIGVYVSNSTLNLGDINTENIDITGGAKGLSIQDGGNGTLTGDNITIFGMDRGVSILDEATGTITGKEITINTAFIDEEKVLQVDKDSIGVQINNSTLIIGNKKDEKNDKENFILTERVNITGGGKGLSIESNGNGIITGKEITISTAFKEEGKEVQVDKDSKGIYVNNSTLNLGDINTENINIIGGAKGVGIQDGGTGTITGQEITISAIGQDKPTSKDDKYRTGVYASGKSINEDEETVDTVNIKGTDKVSIYGMDRGIELNTSSKGTITGTNIVISTAFKEEEKEVQVDKNSMGIYVNNSNLTLGDEKTANVDITGGWFGLEITNEGTGTITGQEITISAIGKNKPEVSDSYRTGVYINNSNLTINGTNKVKVYGEEYGIDIQKSKATIDGREINIKGTDKTGTFVGNKGNLTLGGANTKRVDITGGQYGIDIEDFSTATVGGDNTEILNIKGGNLGVGVFDSSTANIEGKYINIEGEKNIGSGSSGSSVKIGTENSEYISIYGKNQGVWFESLDINKANMDIGNTNTELVQFSGREGIRTLIDKKGNNITGNILGKNILVAGEDGLVLTNVSTDSKITNTLTLGDKNTEIIQITLSDKETVYRDENTGELVKDGKNYGITSNNSNLTINSKDLIYIGLEERFPLIDEEKTEAQVIGINATNKSTIDLISKDIVIDVKDNGIIAKNSTVNLQGSGVVGIYADSKISESVGINSTDSTVNLTGDIIQVVGESGAKIENSGFSISGKDLVQIIGDTTKENSVGLSLSNKVKEDKITELKGKNILLAGHTALTSENTDVNLTGNVIQLLGDTGVKLSNSNLTISQEENSADWVQILGGTTGVDLSNSNLDITSKNIIITGDKLGINVNDNLANLNGEGVVQVLADKNITDSVGLNITPSGNVNLAGNQVAISGDTGVKLENGDFTVNEKMPLSTDKDNFIIDSNSVGISSTNGNIAVNSGDIAIFTNDSLVGNNLGEVTPEAKGSIGINSISSNINLMANNFITSSGYIGLKSQNNSKINIDADTINIYSNRAGLVAYDNSEINLKGKNIYLSGNYGTKTLLNNDDTANKPNYNLETVYSVIYGNEGDINLTGDKIVINSLNTAYGDLSAKDNKKEYVAVHSRGGSEINFNGSTEIYSPNAVALFATDLRGNGGQTKEIDKSTITLSEVGNHKIIGDILAGTNSNISIKGSGNKIGSLGFKELNEVLAINGGTIDIDLSGNGILIGRVDDYHKMTDGEAGFKFRNPKFYQEISQSGEITLNMENGSTWVAIGQNYVTNLDMGNGALVDMGTRFEDRGNSVHINELSGEGTFRMYLNSEVLLENTKNKDIKTDMLYIQNVKLSEGQDSANYTIDTVGRDVLTYLGIGDRLRFATVGGKNADKINFTVNTAKEFGIKNVDFEVGNEYYDKTQEEENSKYNGSETTNLKPGNDLINEEFGESELMPLADEENLSSVPGQNYYLTRKGEREEVNDIGTTIIEMGKSTYANAVYLDNLNKRLGDMTFANGSDGVWVRMRNDRVGEDEHYRLHNYMTQVGYDKAYNLKNGKGVEHRGIAFEYGKGRMEYKDLTGGDTKNDRYIATLYDTRLRTNGIYTDYTLRAGAIHNDFTVYGRETGEKVTGKFNTMLLGAGVEGGKRFDFSDNYYFEPQLQLQYTYIDDTDYTTNQGTKVNYDDVHSLIGRIGVRLGHDFYKENAKDNTIYLKADINHEFLGDEKLTAKDVTGSFDETYDNNKTWFDVGVGGAKNLTENLNVYADVEKQFGSGRDSNSWQFNIGFRYTFNEIKDITLSVSSLFDFDKSEIKPEGKQLIKTASEKLNNKKLKGTLNIEGHTDWIGTREYNQKLSEKRANAVTEEFKKNVTNENIKYESKGYGEDRPIADNNTKEGRAKNRRVEVRYSK